MKLFCIGLILCIYILYTVNSQQPEINDQYEPVNSSIVEISDVILDKKVTEVKNFSNATEKVTPQKNEFQLGFFQRVFEIIKSLIVKFITAPKVSLVLRRIGICLVNGAMELVTYYLPAPFIPLIATAAGLIIPFEPVVLLKEKMPVTSYRRAFNTAVKTFMNTFNKYKMDYDDEEDPYMTRRFNRRFMGDSGEKNRVDEKTKKNTEE